MGRKGDAETNLPLCNGHHRTLHRIGVKTFEARYEISLKHVAGIIAARYDALTTGTTGRLASGAASLTHGHAESDVGP